MSTDPHVTVHVNPDDIDSNCNANPLDADGPTDDVCGNDAVTMVFRPDGRRSYLCQGHGEDVIRFGDDAFADGPPTVENCNRCLRPTPRHRLNIDGVCEKCQT